MQSDPTKQPDSDLYDDTSPLDVDDSDIRILKEKGDLHITPDQASQTSLEAVVEYYLDPKNLPALKSEKRKQLGMLAIALSGAPFYSIPASNYSTRVFGDNLGLRINYIIGTCTPALIVLWNSTDIFSIIRASGRAPEALNQILKKTISSYQNKLEDLAIVTGSALSAMPLTVISLAYPIPGLPLPVLILMATAVQFDNTVLHFLPIKLALSNPLYRLPALPLEYFYKRFVKKVPDEKTQFENTKLRAKEVIYQKHKNLFLGSLGQVRKNIALNAFKFDFRTLQYNVNIPDDVRSAVNAPAENGLARLKKIMTYTIPYNNKPIKFYEPTLRKALYGIGAFWVISSCSGYLAATFTQLSALTKNMIAGAALSSPSIYFLTVLFAFYGGNSLNDVYDYVTSWDEDDLKIPMEFKLFPKTSVALMLFSLYLASFSYAAADELIQDNYNEEEIDGLFTVLVWLAQTGVPFLSLTALIGFFRRMLGKVALHYGDGDTKLIAELDGMLEGLQIGTQFIPGEDFTKSLENLTPEELDTFTGMTVEQLHESRGELSHIDDDQPEVDISQSPRGAYSSLRSEASVSSVGMFGVSSPTHRTGRSMLSNDRQIEPEDDQPQLSR